MTDCNIDHLVNPAVAGIKPYIPGKPIAEVQRELQLDRIVKLASNENPYGPSPKALAAAQAAMSDVYSYPDASCFELRNKLAEIHQLSPDHFVCGSGLDDVISILIKAFQVPGDITITSTYAFVTFGLIVAGFAGQIHRIPECDDFMPNLEAMVAAITPQTKFFYLANPNNPTGVAINEAQLVQLLEAIPAHVLVVLDEAYCHFAQAPDYPDSIALQRRFKNLITLRTFSKAYGLAGLRLGYAVAHPEIIAYMNRARTPFNVNAVVQAAGLAALDDSAHVDHVVTQNVLVKQTLSAFFTRKHIDFIASQTNFLSFRPPANQPDLCNQLLQRGVIIRPLAPFGMPTHARVSIGTMAENQYFCDVMDSMLD